MNAFNTEYCFSCHIALAPHEPDKVIVNGKTYHGACWRRKEHHRILAEFKAGTRKTMSIPTYGTNEA